MYAEMKAKGRLCLKRGRRQGRMPKVVLWLLQWHALTHTHMHLKCFWKLFLYSWHRDQEVAKVWRRMREKLNKGKHFFFFFLLKSKWVDGRDRFWRQMTLWEETTEVRKREQRFRGQRMLASSTSEMINLRRGKCILNKFLYWCCKVKFYSS